MNFQPLIDYIEAVLRTEKQVPGCALKIMRNHETLFTYRSGYRDQARQLPMNGDELYLMYSCTKPITCTAALQLVEQGKLDLDAPVSRYLPEYGQAFLMQEGQQIPVSTPITVRHLFTMTAGLDYSSDAEPVQQFIRENPYASTPEVVATFIRSPLLFEPGTRFEYSLCHDVLAAVVEVVSGISFEDYLQQHIFDPLQMRDTSFDLSADQAHRLATLYNCPEPGKIFPISSEIKQRWTSRHASGGAGLYSTLEDYSRFVDAMANHGIGLTGNQILKPETIDMMRTDQLPNIVKEPPFDPGTGLGYGYGLGVRTLISKADGQRSSLGEFGWNGAAGSYMLIDPAYGLSLMFTTHVLAYPYGISCTHPVIRDLTYDCLGL